ncbi:cytochrome b561 and DOMON domain-containing protein At4g12980 [Spinacia oleracea]|uniref:Cytochrome b561 and DOMON domain-containing protein n=1 Tax=Spinacia oleracea TaxID=3562 RepID=A0A9R0K9I7_SPIOL|nr:cytochrome b561 and DOMON domain-containing protein At4g12980-like [Spinacia oleracea]
MAPLQITLIFSLLFLPLSLSSTCTSPKLTSTYKSCSQLPSLSSSLHFTYNPSNKSLAVAFTAVPPSSSGWVAWGINPISTGMAGTQALVAFRNSDGSMSVDTFNLSSYSDIIPGKISFPVYEKRAVFNKDDGSITIFASVGHSGSGKINHVWQVGPGVTKGFPMKHDFKPENLKATATLDLSADGGGASQASESSTSSDATAKKRNTHGILNAISWGLLFPIGAMIARYVRTIESADPVWFYIHVGCQISGYAIGVAGWATGLQLGSKSVGIVYTSHRYIGIALFALATLQIFALFLRPKKEHKSRFYWNIYHHGVGYAIIILGIINVFKGLHILEPEKKWKSTYVSILVVLGCITVLLEIFTWIVYLRRKSNRSTKPYA